jgi:ABC-type transport system involved in multi-copper enzyme maturation permease subunit
MTVETRATASDARRSLLSPQSSALAAGLRAVLVKELRGRMRGWRALAVLTVYLLVLSGFTLLFYLAATGGRSVAAGGGPAVGKIVFFGVAGLQLGLVAFLAPAFSAGAISGEREKQTFDLLLTTPLPPWVIVAGKLLGALAYLLLLVLAGLPLLSLGYLLGGVAPDEVAVAMALLLVTTLTYGAVGLWFSAHLRSTIGATVLAYATILVPLAAIPLAALLTAGLIFPLFGPNPPAWFLYAGLFLLSLNPLASGGLTAAWLGEGKGLGVIVQEFGQTKLTLLSPWLTLTATYLLACAALIVSSIRRLRPASVRGRRKG